MNAGVQQIQQLRSRMMEIDPNYMIPASSTALNEEDTHPNVDVEEALVKEQVPVPVSTAPVTDLKDESVAAKTAAALLKADKFSYADIAAGRRSPSASRQSTIDDSTFSNQALTEEIIHEPVSIETQVQLSVENKPAVPSTEKVEKQIPEEEEQSFPSNLVHVKENPKKLGRPEPRARKMQSSTSQQRKSTRTPMQRAADSLDEPETIVAPPSPVPAVQTGARPKVQEGEPMRRQSANLSPPGNTTATGRSRSPLWMPGTGGPSYADILRGHYIPHHQRGMAGFIVDSPQKFEEDLSEEETEVYQEEKAREPLQHYEAVPSETVQADASPAVDEQAPPAIIDSSWINSQPHPAQVVYHNIISEPTGQQIISPASYLPEMFHQQTPLMGSFESHHPHHHYASIDPLPSAEAAFASNNYDIASLQRAYAHLEFTKVPTSIAGFSQQCPQEQPTVSSAELTEKLPVFQESVKTVPNPIESNPAIVIHESKAVPLHSTQSHKPSYAQILAAGLKLPEKSAESRRDSSGSSAGSSRQIKMEQVPPKSSLVPSCHQPNVDRCGSEPREARSRQRQFKIASAKSKSFDVRDVPVPTQKAKSTSTNKPHQAKRNVPKVHASQEVIAENVPLEMEFKQTSSSASIPPPDAVQATSAVSSEPEMTKAMMTFYGISSEDIEQLISSRSHDSDSEAEGGGVETSISSEKSKKKSTSHSKKKKLKSAKSQTDDDEIEKALREISELEKSKKTSKMRRALSHETRVHEQTAVHPIVQQVQEAAITTVQPAPPSINRRERKLKKAASISGPAHEPKTRATDAINLLDPVAETSSDGSSDPSSQHKQRRNRMKKSKTVSFNQETAVVGFSEPTPIDDDIVVLRTEVMSLDGTRPKTMETRQSTIVLEDVFTEEATDCPDIYEEEDEIDQVETDEKHAKQESMTALLGPILIAEENKGVNQNLLEEDISTIRADETTQEFPLGMQPVAAMKLLPSEVEIHSTPLRKISAEMTIPFVPDIVDLIPPESPKTSDGRRLYQASQSIDEGDLKREFTSAIVYDVTETETTDDIELDRQLLPSQMAHVECACVQPLRKISAEMTLPFIQDCFETIPETSDPKSSKTCQSVEVEPYAMASALIHDVSQPKIEMIDDLDMDSQLIPSQMVHFESEKVMPLRKISAEMTVPSIPNIVEFLPPESPSVCSGSSIIKASQSIDEGQDLNHEFASAIVFDLPQNEMAIDFELDRQLTPSQMVHLESEKVLPLRKISAEMTVPSIPNIVDFLPPESPSLVSVNRVFQASSSIDEGDLNREFVSAIVLDVTETESTDDFEIDRQMMPSQMVHIESVRVQPLRKISAEMTVPFVPDSIETISEKEPSSLCQESQATDVESLTVASTFFCDIAQPEVAVEMEPNHQSNQLSEQPESAPPSMPLRKISAIMTVPLVADDLNSLPVDLKSPKQPQSYRASQSVDEDNLEMTSALVHNIVESEVTSEMDPVGVQQAQEATSETIPCISAMSIIAPVEEDIVQQMPSIARQLSVAEEEFADDADLGVSFQTSPIPPAVESQDERFNVGTLSEPPITNVFIPPVEPRNETVVTTTVAQISRSEQPKPLLPLVTLVSPPIEEHRVPSVSPFGFEDADHVILSPQWMRQRSPLGRTFSLDPRSLSTALTAPSTTTTAVKTPITVPSTLTKAHSTDLSESYGTEEQKAAAIAKREEGAKSEPQTGGEADDEEVEVYWRLREKKKKKKRRAPLVGSGATRPLSESSSSATDLPTSPTSVASASDFAASESTLTSDDEHRYVVKNSTLDDGFQSGISTPVFSPSNTLSDTAESTEVVVQEQPTVSVEATLESTTYTEMGQPVQQQEPVEPQVATEEQSIETVPEQTSVLVEEQEQPALESVENKQETTSQTESLACLIDPSLKDHQLELPVTKEELDSGAPVKTSWATLVASGKPKVVEEVPAPEPAEKPTRPPPTLVVVGDVQEHLVDEPESFHIGRKERKWGKWRSSQSESQEALCDADAAIVEAEMAVQDDPPAEATPIQEKEEISVIPSDEDVQKQEPEVTLRKSTNKTQQKAAKSVRELEQRKRRSRLSESEQQLIELAEAISENRSIEKFLPPVDQHLKNLAMDAWPKTPSSSFDTEEKLAFINQQLKPEPEPEPIVASSPTELIVEQPEENISTHSPSEIPANIDSRESSFERVMETIGSLLEDSELVKCELNDLIATVETLQTQKEPERQLEDDFDHCKLTAETAMETIGSLLDDEPTQSVQQQPTAMSWANLVATGKPRTTSESTEKAEEDEIVRPKRPLPTLVVVGDENTDMSPASTVTDPDSFTEVVGKRERRLRKWRSSQSESHDYATDDELQHTAEPAVTPIEAVAEQQLQSEPVVIADATIQVVASAEEDDNESSSAVSRPVKDSHKKTASTRTSIPVKETEQRRKRSKLSESEKEALDIAEEIEHGKSIPQLHNDLFADSWPLPLYVLLRQAEYRWQLLEQTAKKQSKESQIEQETNEEVIKTVENEPSTITETQQQVQPIAEVKPLSWAAMVALSKPTPPPPPPLSQSEVCPADVANVHHRAPPVLVVVGDENVEQTQASDNLCPEDEDGFRECVGKREKRRRKWRSSQSESQDTDDTTTPTASPAVEAPADVQIDNKLKEQRSSNKVKSKRQRGGAPRPLDEVGSSVAQEQPVQPYADAYWVDKLAYSDVEKAWHESLSSSQEEVEEQEEDKVSQGPDSSPGPPKPPSPGDPGSRNSDNEPSSSSSQQQQQHQSPPSSSQDEGSSNNDNLSGSGKPNWSDESTYLATDDDGVDDARRLQLKQHKVGNSNASISLNIAALFILLLVCCCETVV